MIKTDEKNFDRDPRSLALINNNVGEYRRRKAAKEAQTRIDAIETDVKSIKDDIQELKTILLGMGK